MFLQGVGDRSAALATADHLRLAAPRVLLIARRREEPAALVVRGPDGPAPPPRRLYRAAAEAVCAPFLRAR
ncbi:hypothetical protein GCM10015535_39570 [Streptomyces gelaticus]|uniref:Uncharacterized protein n=1 Tax=Streptomyces gelaticus TaxID=285446 RepID=A0ABQ2W0T9_9ACTN|nr:hypothetical protein GCM10015535_39570 [Streptomyces gelaticus]